ncbi:hypothetical protein C6H88_01560 [Chlamydia muridarum str. Nigg]|jgi:hypothetical protein|uniref:Uncharacterized protein TC_0300 n=2 Tax=Chlamydia muridarum TaxID=83560 RepID=Y300_CHLMU|nr:hypothetical protein [Chlamydia muridarum]Q9PL08.1 RecName: Full=Uncharacterized protein TC_0300 [Chlamydia muridarum str. Nigg]UFW32846.1 hypothetical protein FTM91_01645 [Chlamydia trachomatis]AAF39165.1 conserved hypothetical protein [Chlamydia muridarum str. Nigg]AHH22690.1 hypothetical protein TAC_01565 [Chlamydia muridarum str. Nigg3 CMUT3-5]AHH23614.1 hypothetical protein Y015_01565 [Chlamydia muridarum str. Nigg CM972]AID37835.1 hypothetical protein BB17_01600 [Chlamydia muridarum 
MARKERLTNEKLNKLFDSPFSLVNYVIKQTKNRIARGDVRSSNVAIEALNFLDLYGIQSECLERDDREQYASGAGEKRKEQSSGNSRRKDPSLYNWSDVK